MLQQTLPQNRQLRTIESLFWDIKIGWTPSREKTEFFWWGIPWVSIKDMEGKKEIYETNETLSEEGIRNSNVKLVQKGSLLFSFKLTVWRMSFAGVDLYTNEAITAFEPNPEIELTYLYYVLPVVAKQVDRTNNYWAPLLNKNIIKSLQIPLPPLEEQKKIVVYLDELNATISKLKSEYQSQLAMLDEMRNSSLDLAFWGSREREHTT